MGDPIKILRLHSFGQFGSSGCCISGLLFVVCAYIKLIELVGGEKIRKQREREREKKTHSSLLETINSVR